MDQKWDVVVKSQVVVAGGGWAELDPNWTVSVPSAAALATPGNATTVTIVRARAPSPPTIDLCVFFTGGSPLWSEWDSDDTSMAAERFGRPLWRENREILDRATIAPATTERGRGSS